MSGGVQGAAAAFGAPLRNGGGINKKGGKEKNVGGSAAAKGAMDGSFVESGCVVLVATPVGDSVTTSLGEEEGDCVFSLDGTLDGSAVDGDGDPIDGIMDGD